MEKITLAQLGYQAYGKWLAWKTPTGNSVRDLPMSLQNAWTAAAEVIVVEIRKEAVHAEALEV